MEQHVAARNAERPDDDIDRLADRMAPASQQAVIRRRLHSQFGVKQRNGLELPQPTLDQSRFPFGSQPLQDLAQDQITDKQRYRRDQFPQPADGFRRDVVQVIDPNRAIDEDHGVRGPADSRRDYPPSEPYPRASASAPVP